MKKSLFAFTCLFLFLGLINSHIALADDPTNYSNLTDVIQNLKNIIKNLSDQINQLVSEVSVIHSRLNFGRELKLGMSGTDVKQLQEFLVDKVPDNLSQDLITGYFGLHTQNALKKFQENQGLQPSGIFDAETRDNLAMLAESNATSSDLNFLNLEITTSTKKVPPGVLLPTVHISYPTQYSIVGGGIDVAANITQGTFAISTIQFNLDGSALGNPLTSNPYVTYWDTTTAQNGPHTLSATVTDENGNAVDAGAITFSVSNSNNSAPSSESSPPPEQSAPSVQPLAISNVQAVSITKSSSTITWVTNNPASSEVDYSKTSGVPISQSSKVTNTALVSNHSLILSNLNSGTIYYYFVLSNDANNQTASSSISSFTTNH